MIEQAPDNRRCVNRHQKKDATEQKLRFIRQLWSLVRRQKKYIGKYGSGAQAELIESEQKKSDRPNIINSWFRTLSNTLHWLCPSSRSKVGFVDGLRRSALARHFNASLEQVLSILPSVTLWSPEWYIKVRIPYCSNKKRIRPRSAV